MSDDLPFAEIAATEEAFEVKGFKAAVFKPMFGQAHQQYFTPRWLCEAMLPIAEHAFGFHTMLPRRPAPAERRRPHRRDRAGCWPPSSKAGHNVLAVELDARLAEIAAKALGKRSVRQGDIMAYGSLIPQGRWQVAAINPPYGLWWPTPDGSPYREYELRAGEQHREPAHDPGAGPPPALTYQNGLLMAVLSGKFFDNNPAPPPT